MTMNIAIQNESKANYIPDNNELIKWTNAALNKKLSETEVTIRIVDEEEGRKLNKQWRNKDYATNVLSFPIGDEIKNVPGILGDIVICAPVVKYEANEQQKKIEAHWAHLIVHGMLHLQGFDHEAKEETNTMETREISILSKLGYANPYEI